ncbi:MAG: SDR family oxidoreductase, partial [Deltaproteobacteria bacterium]|nr:SDR family oxidoreductase [Deltaproteobacteria bacterium]
MDLGLNGKRALITGSTAGIGEAAARMLAAEGAAVVVHGRNELRGRTVCEGIRAAGGKAELVLGDFSETAAAELAAAKALAGGNIDILVNNAGEYPNSAWETCRPENWSRLYQVNVVAAMILIQRLVPGMRERGWGRVIQIGGGLAGQPFGSQPDYTATLAARHNLAVSLARNLKGSGVTSNIVSPGAVAVASVRKLLQELSPQYGWGETWAEIEAGCVRD